MSEQQTWQWAIITISGIFDGDLTGTPEPHDTPRSCLEQVLDIAKKRIEQDYGQEVIAGFVTDGTLSVNIGGDNNAS